MPHLREELDELGAEVTRANSLAELPAVLALRFPSQEGYELQVGPLAGEPLFRSVGIGSKGLPRPADVTIEFRYCVIRNCKPGRSWSSPAFKPG